MYCIVYMGLLHFVANFLQGVCSTSRAILDDACAGVALHCCLGLATTQLGHIVDASNAHASFHHAI